MPRRDRIEQMLKQEPDDVFLNFSFAMELSKENESDRALAQFDRVLSLDPTYTAAHYHKGNTLIGLGRQDEARVVLTEGVAACKQIGDDHAHREMLELLTSIA